MNMNISDIASQVALLLGKHQTAEDIGIRKYADILVTDEEIARIVESVNIAAEEIAEDFFPLISQQTITSDQNAEVPFSAFTNKFHLVLRTLDQNGKKVSCKVFDSFLKLPEAGRDYTFVYAFVPEHAVEKEQIAVASQVNRRMLAYCACSAFCFWNMLYDEAKMWKDRFLDAVSEAKKRDRRIKGLRVRRTWEI